jgi:xylulokinase
MNAMNEYILAIDLGTSGPKITLVTVGGELIAYEREKTKLYLLPDCGAEQDPADWWKAIRRATRRLLKREPVPAEAIVAIGCTSQWAGTVAVDREGRPLMNALIWMDARGAPYVKHIVRGPVKVAGYGATRLITWLRLTGGVPGLSGKDPIGHILYIRGQHPDIYQKTYKFLEPLDYVNMLLTGQFAASYHSITMHWLTDNRQIDRVRYDPKLLKMVGIEREKLPDLKKGTHILGSIRPEVAIELGLTPDVQVVMGAPDLHAAAIGSGAVQDYAGNLYIGTSSWLTCHVPFKKTDVLHSIGSVPSAVPGRYLVINEQQMAGACLNFLRDNILYPAEELARVGGGQIAYGLLDQLAREAPPGSDRLIFTPWLNGERTPVDDHLTRGGFYNLSLQHKRAHLVRAVMEGVAFNTRWLLGYVEGFIQRKLNAIHIGGGGAHSEVWCLVHADVLKRPVHQIKEPIQATARGAALLAAVALGYVSFDDVTRLVKVATIFEPNTANSHIYDELFQEYLQLYRRNKGIYHRLNRPEHSPSGRIP